MPAGASILLWLLIPIGATVTAWIVIQRRDHVNPNASVGSGVSELQHFRNTLAATNPPTAERSTTAKTPQESPFRHSA